MAQVEVTTGGYTRMVDAAIAKRIRIETRIAKSAIGALLKAGYTLGVFDSEEVTLQHSKDAKAILAAMQTTDEDSLIAYDAASGKQVGWVRFVYGNDGWDVICDYTTNLEDVLAGTNALAEKISESL